MKKYKTPGLWIWPIFSLLRFKNISVIPDPEGFFPVDFGKNFSNPLGGSEE